jgi:glycosyltransferase involved in cell wall biosynthesis
LESRKLKVSVIIPTFKTAEYIRSTLDSVFSQTFKDFEVIVVNDGCPDTDELERVIAPYRERIRYFRQTNRGPAGARNTGIRHARGEYVAFLDSDDCWLPNYLASQLGFFKATPSLDVLYCDAYHFGDPALAGKTYMQTCPSAGPVTLESLIKEDCQVICSGTIARKRAIEVAGLFDENDSLRGCEDYDLWLRIAYRGGRMAYQRKVLARYRSRPGSLSRDTTRMSEAILAVYKKAEQIMELPEETRSTLRQKLAQAQAHLDLAVGKDLLAAGELEQATQSLARANHFFDSAKLRLAVFGLRTAPSLTRLAARVWHKSIS